LPATKVAGAVHAIITVSTAAFGVLRNRGKKYLCKKGVIIGCRNEGTVEIK